MNWLQAIFGGGDSGGGVAGVVKSLGDTAAQFIEKPEDRLKFQQAVAGADLEVRKLAFEAEKLALEDRQGARAMFDKAGWLQAVFALTFLAGYLLLTVAFMWILAGAMGWTPKLSVPEWGQALLSAIWGQFSGKLGTIVDFLFGSSQGSRAKDDAVTEAMKRVPAATP